jgi:tetratricopeptide (TPR) repeat protein
MLAITYSGRPEAIEWNQRGLELARPSEDPKALALIPAILNNRGWDLHDMGHFAEALPLFEEGLAMWLVRGNPKQILVAKWAVARCLRSLGRNDDALAILRELEAEHAATDSVDGTVLEEIAENLAALGELDEAQSGSGGNQ